MELDNEKIEVKKQENLQNFPVKVDNKEYWISRSCVGACLVFAFNRKNELCILANKRGNGCEFYKGYWNVPGGFLDYNETTKRCALRELFEETGVTVAEENLHLLDIDDNPVGKRQNISFRYYTLITDNVAENIATTNMYCEPDEVEKIEFIPVDYIYTYKWTRDQEKYINMAAKKIKYTNIKYYFTYLKNKFYKLI